jgi:hypothetical protein
VKADLGGWVIEFELKRSARARVPRLEIHLHGGVRVVLPEGERVERAEALLKSKSRWILRHLARFEKLGKIVPNRRLEHGARVPFLGRELTLDVVRGPSRIGRLGDSLIVSVPTPGERSVRRALTAWYRRAAEEEMERRVRRHGLRVRGVRIGDARTRWGSCSASGFLRFNWRLMLAPPEIVDYMVAHELAHLAHKDHAAAFWARVRELDPDCAHSERWLKQNGVGLVL